MQSSMQRHSRRPCVISPSCSTLLKPMLSEFHHIVGSSRKIVKKLQHAMGVEAVNMASWVYLHVTPIVPHGAKRVPSASGLTICQLCADNLAPLEDWLLMCSSTLMQIILLRPPQWKKFQLHWPQIWRMQPLCPYPSIQTAVPIYVWQGQNNSHNLAWPSLSSGLVPSESPPLVAPYLPALAGFRSSLRLRNRQLYSLYSSVPKSTAYTSANRAALNSISYLCSFPNQCLHILQPRYQQSSSVVPLHHPDQHNCRIRPHPRMFPNWRHTCVNSLPVVLSTTHHHFHPCLARLPKSIWNLVRCVMPAIRLFLSRIIGK